MGRRKSIIRKIIGQRIRLTSDDGFRWNMNSSNGNPLDDLVVIEHVEREAQLRVDWLTG